MRFLSREISLCVLDLQLKIYNWEHMLQKMQPTIIPFEVK